MARGLCCVDAQVGGNGSSKSWRSGRTLAPLDGGAPPAAPHAAQPLYPLPASSALLAVAETVLSRYRRVHYHSWHHGFDAAHCVYLLVSRTAAADATLGPVDRLALLLASLAHDVDHPGHTNGFEVAGLSDLALTYNNQSVLENHHAATLFR